jgi:pyruvate,water dikinase
VATARVLAGPQDFGRMRPGDVLVASIATPAWTSLFAMAAAVVTDIGGPLSHSSIVAREYGIPAVLGTGAATRRITDGARIRVDGDAGTVTLLDEPDEPDEPAAATERRSRTALVAAGGGIAALGLGWWLRRHR